MEQNKSEALQELREHMRALHQAGKFPRGYAKTVVNRLAERDIEVSESAVRHVAGGKFANRDIVEELLNLAEESWERKQLERAKKLLEEK